MHVEDEAMDRLRYADCAFPVRWAGEEGAFIATIPTLRLQATAATREEAFSALARKLVTLFERVTQRAIYEETRRRSALAYAA